MWVIDWYAFIVQHNPTPAGFKNGKGNAYETDLRDKTHGRIYRVVYTKAKPEKPCTLKDATPERLVETLKHPNMTWRLHAQRLLVERGNADVVPALTKLIEDKSVDETGLNAGAVHAVWTLAGLKKESPEFVWSHPCVFVQCAALLAAAKDSPDGELDSRIANAISAANPSIRFAGLRASGELPIHKELEVLGQLELAKALSKRLNELDTDSHLRAALLSASSCTSGTVLRESVSTQTATPEGLSAIESLARHYAMGGGDTIEVFNILLKCEKGSPATAGAIINGFAAGWPANKPLEFAKDGDDLIGRILPKLPPASRGRLLKLASTWGVKGIDEQLAAITKTAFATLADAKAKDADRVAAALQVIEFQPESDDAATKLLAAVTPEASSTLTAGIFEALSQSKAKGVGSAVVAKLKDLPPEVRPAALRLVLAKADSAKAFLDAVERGTLRFDMLALDQRTALASHPDKDVSERAKKLLALGGGLPSPDRQKVIEELKSALAMTGDVANGKKMFVAHCAKCHKHGTEGVTIGPDLTGFGVHPKEELVIAILDPSRSVEGNFKLYRVTTTDDRTLLGILGAQTATSVEIIDAEAKRHALAKTDIVTLKETDKSLMPEGFEKIMKPAELADLLEFLSQKGKFVPLPLDKVATIVSTKGMFFDEADTTGRLVFPDWKPKVFEGVPFVLVDPQKDTVKNVVMLYSPSGTLPNKMPKSVSLPFNGKAKTVHILGGIAGWAAPFDNEKTVSMIVRLTYADGKTEDHELKNAVHIADYIRKVDVPESKFAFALRNQQVRYLAVSPKRPDAVVKTIEFVKGPDKTAPVVMAVTVETP